MTTEKKNSSTPFSFTTFDGTDENGVRAEVYVQANKGVIKEIKENADKQVADIHFGVANLKFPVHGWVRTDYALYDLVKTAYENQEEVTFRIETQRKPKVDRSTKMEELRVDSQTARDNVKVILVGINGIYSDEAVTNPAEDPRGTGGRYVAGDADISTKPSTQPQTSYNLEEGIQTLTTLASNPVVRLSVIDAIAAQLLLQGADIETINKAIVPENDDNDTQPEQRQSFSRESKPWDTYNSDGRLNLGSAIITAGVGIETLVADRIQVRLEEEGITHLTNQDDLVSYYTVIIFAICDRIQEVCYGTGFKADRKAGSHARVRGIVYEMVKKDFALPFVIEENTAKVNSTTHEEWVKTVGKEGIKRFSRAIRASVTETGFKTVLPESLIPGGKPAGSASNAPVAEPAPATQTTPVTASEPASAPVEQPAAKEEPPAKETSTASVEVATPVLEVAEDEDMYIHRLTAEDVDGEELATEETITFFKNTLSELGLNIADVADQARIAKLLSYSFGKGYSNARKIPDTLLEDFAFFYQAGGAEALDKAIRKAVQQGNQ